MGWNITLDKLVNFARLEPRRIQELLPELVGKLIKASVNPKHFRFPKGEDIRLRGFDGELESNEETAYIPVGYSVWEMSTERDCTSKANKDFLKREPDPEKTYVQLFLHEWPKANEWLEEKSGAGWKGIKTIHGTQLIEWLEDCPAIHRWLAFILGERIEDCLDSEEAWKFWASETQVRSIEELVLADRGDNVEKLAKVLEGEPCSIAVIGESTSDASAFIVGTIKDNDILAARFLRILDVSQFNQLSSSGTGLILLVPLETPDIGYAIDERKHHIIYALPKEIHHLANIEIKLTEINYSSRQSALVRMGLKRGRSDKIVSQCQNNLEFIRMHPDLGPRHHNTFPWMRESKYSGMLKTLFCFGSLDLNNSDEITLFAETSNTSVEKLRSLLDELLQFENHPIVLRHNWVHIESRIPLWSAIKNNPINSDQLEDIFCKVFDFTLRGPQDESLDQSSLNFSSILKKNLIDLLRFYSYLIETGSDKSIVPTQSFLDEVAYNILSKTSLHWQSQIIKGLAEATPDVVLDHIDYVASSLGEESMSELNGNGYQVFSALEVLAWHQDYIVKVTRTLGRIANNNFDQNLKLQSIQCLGRVYKLWFPQTVISKDERMKLLEDLLLPSQPASWMILMNLIPRSSRDSAFPSSTPEWKEWDENLGKITRREYIESIDRLMDIAFTLISESPLDRWEELIRRFAYIPETSFEKGIGILAEILLSTDINKQQIQDRIRTEVKRLLGHEKFFGDKKQMLGEERCTVLTHLMEIGPPLSDIEHCFYLLSEPIPYEVADIGRIDSIKRREKTEELQVSAVRELYLKEDIKGLELLVDQLKNEVSIYMVLDKIEEFKTDKNLFLWLFSENPRLERIASQLITWKSRREPNWLETIIRSNPQWDDEKWSKLCKYYSLCNILLRFIESKPNIKDRFWSERWDFMVTPEHIEILNEVIEKLLVYKKIASAFECLNMAISQRENSVGPEIIKKALIFQTTDPINDNGIYSILDSSNTANLIRWLQTKQIDEETMIQIEWLHLLDIVDNHGTPSVTLDKLTSDPIFFVDYFHTISIEAERATDISDRFLTDRKNNTLLSLLTTLPGEADGVVNPEILEDFINKARDQAQHIVNLEEIDIKLGRWLGQSQNDHQDGFWPCSAVRRIFENCSKTIEQAFIDITIYPDNISMWSGSGSGSRYTEKIEMYKKSAQALSLTFPQTAKMLRVIYKHYEERESLSN